jgi:hypothetical protein
VDVGTSAVTLCLMECPPLIPYVTRMAFHCSTHTDMPVDADAITFMIEEVGPNGEHIGGNMAFWTPENWGPGDNFVFSAQWDYDPRHGDMWLEDGADRYIGLMAQRTGGTTDAVAVSSALQVFSGAIPSRYWPTP